VRIVAGLWRGRRLAAPAGRLTRPTADRVRQALFDMLLHAPWGGRAAVDGARVVDAFAGTGAMGLEALSRGAGFCTFLECDEAALAVLRANVALCGAGGRCAVLAADATRPPPGTPCDLAILDPPYGEALLPAAVAGLAATGWIAPGCLVVAELGRKEALPDFGELLADRTHGAARLAAWRADADRIAASLSRLP
jgi:16S rRNA (guanine966-N2)-methyltransferase